MMTEVGRTSSGRRTVDITVSIILMVFGVIVLVIETALDVLLALTSADSPGDIEGATSFAFTLLLLGGIVWLVASIIAIVLLARRKTAWILALVGVVASAACTVGGFIAVTTVVQ